MSGLRFLPESASLDRLRCCPPVKRPPALRIPGERYASSIQPMAKSSGLGKNQSFFNPRNARLPCWVRSQPPSRANGDLAANVSAPPANNPRTDREARAVQWTTAFLGKWELAIHTAGSKR